MVPTELMWEHQGQLGIHSLTKSSLVWSKEALNRVTYQPMTATLVCFNPLHSSLLKDDKPLWGKPDEHSSFVPRRVNKYFESGSGTETNKVDSRYSSPAVPVGIPMPCRACVFLHPTTPHIDEPARPHDQYLQLSLWKCT